MLTKSLIISNFTFLNLFFKLRLILFLILLSVNSGNLLSAQILSATIKVNGLTCSQCSRSVEMQLRKLDFVGSVDMDLQATEAKVYFKKNSNIDFYKLAKAVDNGGFSVGNLIATLDFSTITIVNDNCFKIKNNAFALTNPTEERTKKIVQIQFLGKEFGNKNTQQKQDNQIICKGKNTYWVSEL